MAIDFSTTLYLHCQDFYSRAVIITPIVSSPGAPAYQARGIYGTRDVEVTTGDPFGSTTMALISDQQTIFDIRDNEFFDSGYVLPQQGDLLNIPREGNIPAEGDFEVTDTQRNGGGETTLVIRKYEAAVP
jgi:hypothetical protein